MPQKDDHSGDCHDIILGCITVCVIVIVCDAILYPLNLFPNQNLHLNIHFAP